MSKVYLSYNNIISSLGFNSNSVVNKIHEGGSGLTKIHDTSILPNPFYSSLINAPHLEAAFSKITLKKDYTKLEKMMITSLHDTITQSGIEVNNEKVGLIISTTKGNIDALDTNNPFPENRSYLHELAHTITAHFGFKNKAITVSNACVSGILAIAIAKRYIQQKIYDHVFVVGGDLVTEFILSGFNSFQALSEAPCKPYDKNRTGINIGEIAASTLITKNNAKLAPEAVEILGEGSCNDANHISGPSRTGEGLYRSIQSAMTQANVSHQDIDYISAHGTATMYNDEMEAIAFNRHHLENVPVNSLKGYFGHTLGASGLVETIIGAHSLYNNTLYPSLGFEDIGVTQPINIITKTTPQPLHTFLKTASGFGGCNTAVIFKKHIH
ncbi:beta-ketoacyl-[acyl-carrier-protein] synthase family protein [Mangrovimonas spongiae]|uniref:Nodulation protein E n=1 Tax=Mangrovimonas spongiae TaxID=2494697 RepID=A0A3R9MAU1_9FLAO|nr:beta-ketoacyl synthase N-terminal-like domain-containing protein [Mangrovimonas spongiae]RSK41380.1 beta-ketoacyl synthase [Mangrovimonas spongiae]